MTAATPAEPEPETPELLPVITGDGARFELMLVAPSKPAAHWLYWIPAMGVPARHYLPLARALADLGVATAIHEWRGIGSSSERATRRNDWAYRQLLQDLDAGVVALQDHRNEASTCIGGHSLGGQFACLYSALHPADIRGIALIASGSPYWRCYRHAWLTWSSFVLAGWVASLVGYLPGRRIGFGGNEARGVVADWSCSGRSGRYDVDGLENDLEKALGRLQTPVLALRLRGDWMVPPASMEHLLGKLSSPRQRRIEIGAEALQGQRPDHFSWMKTPASLATKIVVWINELVEASSDEPAAFP